MELANGQEPDGINYLIKLSDDASTWNASVWKDDRRIERSFRVGYRPVAGPDVSDVQEGEKLLDSMINELRSTLEK